MPAANQGSRGALIAWTVATSILGVTAMVIAIYFYVDSNRVNESTETKLKQVNEVVTSAMVASEGDKLTELRESLKDPARGLPAGMKLFDVALAQRDGLAKLIGSESEPKAQTEAKAALEKAKIASGTNPESLVAAVNALITKVESLQTEVNNSKQDSKESRDKLTQTLNDTKAQIDQLTKAMETVRGEKDTVVSDETKRGAAQGEAFDRAAEDLRKQFAISQEELTKLNGVNGQLGQEIEKLKTVIIQLQNRLGVNRIDTASMMTRQSDGKIVRIGTSSKTVFIDLGQGDHISPGLTFEVYDRYDGIPPAGDPSTDTGLPVGKASIEVIRVTPLGSECQVNRLQYGQPLVEGDLIANLVYDRNMKFNFVVYGDFDLDGNRVATADDTAKIKQLITDWGGNVVSDINVNTDFVILGKEPIVPEKPSDDDSLAVKNYNDAIANLAQYDEISGKARDYRLPILNQNRFLVLCGYFSIAKR